MYRIKFGLGFETPFPARSEDTHSGSLQSILKCLIYLSRFFGVVQISFADSQPDFGVVDIGWTIYSIVFMAVFASISLFLSSAISYGNAFTTPVVTGVFGVTSLAVLVSQAASLFFRRDLANIVNFIMPCTNLSKKTRKRAVALCCFQVLVLSLHLCGTFVRRLFIMNKELLSFFRSTILSISWDFITRFAQFYVYTIFLIFVQIITGKLESLSEKIQSELTILYRKSLVKRYLDIWKCAEKINQVFGLPLLFSLLMQFSRMVWYLYVVVTVAHNPGRTVGMFIMILCCALEVAILLAVGDTASKTVRCSLRPNIVFSHRHD